ncbi:MAG: tetratricopeptide repeat protein [Deltaproteobacteria bacterium]|nr:tetratricopeptide repeat protein [Deltaproteobacteria bacterium]MBM4298536.1 tetratricopeptide repeat protein [Deltaproteobacteria bacterium]
MVAKACFLMLLMMLHVVACTHAIPRLGLSGRYLEGRDQFLRGRGGDMDRAVGALENVVREDPTYKDSLTLLGRAYYRQERYADAHVILQRALAVNKDDEIAWLTLGLTQLRLNDNHRGMESLKGAITQLSRVSVRGYREYEDWDSNNQVRTELRRCALVIAKGVDFKQDVLRATEVLLARMDEEENFQRINKPRQQQRDR